LALAVGGCARAALPCELELDAGDLVITEIRGPQDGVDSRGEWFELYNTTADSIDLYGLRGTMTNLKACSAAWPVRPPRWTTASTGISW